MAAFFSQWGKILATAGSYERAHFFGNVQHEVDNATDAFQYIADRMAVVLSGDHKEAMALQFISLSLTAVFCGAIISPALAESVTGLEKAALTFYFFLFISSLDQYALGISTLRTAVVEVSLRRARERFARPPADWLWRGSTTLTLAGAAFSRNERLKPRYQRPKTSDERPEAFNERLKPRNELAVTCSLRSEQPKTRPPSLFTAHSKFCARGVCGCSLWTRFNRRAPLFIPHSPFVRSRAARSGHCNDAPVHTCPPVSEAGRVPGADLGRERH